MKVGVRKLITYIIASIVLVPFIYVVVPMWLISVSESLNIFKISFVGQEIVGAIIFLVGLLLFPYCSSIFFKHGERTPLFTETEGKFFKNGIYEKTRNPMYVGHVLVALGIFVWNGSLLLLGYAFVGWLILQSYLIFIEEPQLIARYGKTYKEYMGLVPRWIWR